MERFYLTSLASYVTPAEFCATEDRRHHGHRVPVPVLVVVASIKELVRDARNRRNNRNGTKT